MRYPLFYKKLPKQDQELLFQNFKFYRNLKDSDRKLFDHRVVRFIAHHEFVGHESLIVTRKMILLIAGTGISLSFGFKEYLYGLFNIIILYPSNYYSGLTQTQNKGETNPKFGVVVFSWEDFKAGLAIENDNLHLGLHEFCHALHFSFTYNKTAEGQNFLETYTELLHYLESKEVQRHLIQTGYIREYAFENQYEFLAVLIEHLYETPRKFEKELPVIYRLLLRLFKIEKAVLL